MWRNSLSAVLAVSVLAACGPKKDDAAPVQDTSVAAVTPPPPPPMPQTVAPGHVAVKLVCGTSGVEFNLDPWTVEAAADDSFTWDNDAASNVEVEITTGHSGPPFGGMSHKADHGKPVTVKPVAGTTHGKKYKYMVKATCSDGRKVVIDPDMIIPTRTQSTPQ